MRTLNSTLGTLSIGFLFALSAALIAGDPVKPANPDLTKHIVISLNVKDKAGRPIEGAAAMIDFNSGGRYKGEPTDKLGNTKIILQNPSYSKIWIEHAGMAWWFSRGGDGYVQNYDRHGKPIPSPTDVKLILDDAHKFR